MLGFIGIVSSFRSASERVIAPLGIPQTDALLVVAIFIAIIIVIYFIFDIRMSATRSTRLSDEKLSHALADLNLRVSDYISVTTNEISMLSEEIKSLTIQIDMFEDFLLENPAFGFKTGDSESISNRTELDLQPDDQLADTRVREIVPSGANSVKGGLSFTREKILSGIKAIIGIYKENNVEFFEQLEKILISCDLGVSTCSSLIQHVQKVKKENNKLDASALLSEIRRKIIEILGPDSTAIKVSQGGKTPTVLLMVGVNGVGKTTTIGKLAREFSQQGAKVLIAAADTFRAAATEQVQIWGDRSNVEVVLGPNGAKPSTVLYDAIKRVKEEGFDVLLVDTAGRFHTRANLMKELKSLSAMVNRELGKANIENFLIVDGSTGQNALQQARDFHKAVSLSGIVVTKLDGSYKGGIVVAIKKELGVPIRYIGIGEGVDDLKRFNGEEFVNALFDGNDTLQNV